MKLLEEVAKRFGTSKPVFEAVMTYNDTCINFSVKDPYKPIVSELDDPVARVIARRFQETLKGNQFVQCTHLPTVYSDIVENITDFYERHSPLQNPKQTKLYKWLRTMENRYNTPAAEGFIGLYRYIHGRLEKLTEDDVQNVLAILGMMREKYEDTD